jgi:hypothetical protein
VHRLIFLITAPLCAQTLTDSDLATGDRHAIAEHFRNRAKPVYNLPTVRADLARADRALRHEFESIGYPHTFGPVIDWHFDKTAEPASKYAANNEWTWQLNRHAEWIALARAYRQTKDEKYAREFVTQVLGWVKDCPMPRDAGNAPRSAWRTIETGIRAGQVWPELWYSFLHSPSMTDDALLTFLQAYVNHAHHLMAFHTTGNWLAMEGNGLYYTGVLFPEFRESAEWRATAAKWIYDEMNNQVYPDGVQIELTSGYHHVSLNNFLSVYKIAKLNDQPLPPDFLKRLEKMYDFDVYGAMPDRRLPGVQDSNYLDIRRALEEAAGLFPDRADFRWYGTGGREGKPPSETNHAFPWAGYYVMRSGWDPDARYLWFDGGPFGYGHQHEDKLQIIVEAYGKLLLVDPGSFAYERSKWRNYFIDSYSHNVVLVDGQPQRRRGAPRETYIAKQPATAVWGDDYVEATFDENFGGEVKTSVTHTRAVLFVRPDFWVVRDLLRAKDGNPHTYEALFHFDSKVKAEGLHVVTQNAAEANLTVAARADDGMSLKIVEGQEDPVQGWLPAGMSGVRPAPVAIFTARGVTKEMLYVLAPSPNGAADPIHSIRGVNDAPGVSLITLADGRVFEVRFQEGSASGVWRH